MDQNDPTHGLRQDPLPCIVCGKVLEPVYESNHPNDGIACTSHGNYGSRVFDSVDGHFLEFNVCDKCLVSASESGRIALGYLRAPLVEWRPGLEDEYPTPEEKRAADEAHECMRRDAEELERIERNTAFPSLIGK